MSGQSKAQSVPNEPTGGVIEPLQRNIWFKKNCVSCNRRDMPFEQWGWQSCLGCTIDTRLFQIEGAFNPRNRKQTAKEVQKKLDNLFELWRIYAFAEVWKEILSMEYWGLITIQYKGKHTAGNFTSLTLTDKGKEALGRMT